MFIWKEYGAVAILSASGYGNANTLQNSKIKTTTGNKSGVYFSGNNWEAVAGGLYTGLGTANVKYYDTYTDSIVSAKIGDSLGNSSTTNPGCTGWHSSGNSIWTTESFKVFFRGGSGLFSYNYQARTDSGLMVFKGYSRGVAVVGEGF